MLSKPPQQRETPGHVSDPVLDRGEGRASTGDPVLADLRIANLARLIAAGDRVSSWHLGAAIAAALVGDKRND